MMNLKDCRKIGILGGTFNPIHLAHLLMAEYALEAAKLDKVIIMPSGISYLKRDRKVLPASDRLKMVELSIRNNPNLIASDLEIKREGNTYTYETLKELKSIYPDIIFYFIVGADCLFTIENWVEPKQIFENCILLAAGRNSASNESMLAKKQELEDKFDAHIVLMDFPQINISSTKIREKIKDGKSIRYMVTDEVRDYICNNQLFKD